MTALSQEAYQLPMRDWFGETQVYVRWQKAAEEQKRFDKAKTLSCFASRDHPAPLYSLRPMTGNPEIIPAPLMGGGDLAAACLVASDYRRNGGPIISKKK